MSYVLFGGQAVNLHGIPRFTENVDLFVDPATENVARLRRALRRVWDDPAIEEIRAEDLAGDYAVVRYGTPDEFAVDLVARIGEVYRYADVEYERSTLDGVPVRIATPRMLYRMKKDTVRAIDHADAADLKAKFGIEEDWRVSVRKFRTFEEARRALWLPAGDPRILERMRRLAELAVGRPVPRGVRRFRSIQEAEEERTRPISRR